jgi:hypothetical protein
VKRSKSIKAVELAAAQEGYLAKYRDLTLARSPRNSEKLAINSPSKVSGLEVILTPSDCRKAR